MKVEETMKKHTLEVKKDGFYIDNEKFFLISGDFHYFRTHPDGWRRRLKLMKDFGLTAVTTYVAWNLHEPEQGQYNFEGIADICRFLREAQEEGLKVVLRCSPYMCAEWDLGGLPAWLLKDRQICLRSSDPKFMGAVTGFFRILAEKIRPYLATNGGPIILAGVENEYGSFGNDKKYLRELIQLYQDCGIDVPLISANGSDPFKYWNGTLPENWNGIDCSALPGGIRELDRLQSYQPDKPLMAGEAWCGNMQFWGRKFDLNRNIKENAEYLKLALEKQVYVNLYMFCGGTNFAFTSGSNRTVYGDETFIPLTTSYDYDAPISEDGVPREKYFALRDVLDEYLGKEKRPHIAPEHKVQAIPNTVLTESARLFDNLDVVTKCHVYSERTQCMEDLNTYSGFILYTTQLEYTDNRLRHVRLYDLADRAMFYLDGRYLGTVMRDGEKNPDISFRIPQGGAELAILVENLGHTHYGHLMYDRKGILGSVRFLIENEDGTMLYNFANQTGFDIRTIPFKTLDGIVYQKGGSTESHTPTLWRGSFDAEPGADTFIDMRGFAKGFVFVNGYNLGRYWSVGPQMTLYVPGEILKEHNTVEICELHRIPEEKKVSFIDHALLCEQVEGELSLLGFELL